MNSKEMGKMVSRINEAEEMKKFQEDSAQRAILETSFESWRKYFLSRQKIMQGEAKKLGKSLEVFVFLGSEKLYVKEINMVSKIHIEVVTENSSGEIINMLCSCSSIIIMFGFSNQYREETLLN